MNFTYSLPLVECILCYLFPKNGIDDGGFKVIFNFVGGMREIF